MQRICEIQNGGDVRAAYLTCLGTLNTLWAQSSVHLFVESGKKYLIQWVSPLLNKGLICGKALDWTPRTVPTNSPMRRSSRT